MGSWHSSAGRVLARDGVISHKAGTRSCVREGRAVAATYGATQGHASAAGTHQLQRWGRFMRETRRAGASQDQQRHKLHCWERFVRRAGASQDQQCQIQCWERFVRARRNAVAAGAGAAGSRRSSPTSSATADEMDGGRWRRRTSPMPSATVLASGHDKLEPDRTLEPDAKCEPDVVSYSAGIRAT